MKNSPQAETTRGRRVMSYPAFAGAHILVAHGTRKQTA